jgi:hypothetical protein
MVAAVRQDSTGMRARDEVGSLRKMPFKRWLELDNGGVVVAGVGLFSNPDTCILWR